MEKEFVEPVAQSAPLKEVVGGPCQFCMAGSTFGAEKAQLVLYEGQWQPWPLVASRPDAPMIHCDICPVCDRERFNAEEVPRLNEKFHLLQAERSDAAPTPLSE